VGKKYWFCVELHWRFSVFSESQEYVLKLTCYLDYLRTATVSSYDSNHPFPKEALTNKRRCTRHRLVHFPWDKSVVVATHTRTHNVAWSTSNAFQYDGSPTWNYELLLLHPRGFSARVSCGDAHVTRDVGFESISQLLLNRTCKTMP
jgi:hypothetical protein